MQAGSGSHVSAVQVSVNCWKIGRVRSLLGDLARSMSLDTEKVWGEEG